MVSQYLATWTDDWTRAVGHLQTANRLAPLGGLAPDRPRPSLAARLWSRARSTASLLLTPRQKQCNLEVVGALSGMADAVLAMRKELAVLTAELASLKNDLEPPHFRPGTLDHLVWADVNEKNEYELPDAFAPTDVVVDIGAHVGSFSFACLRRGAGAVVAFEPDADNFGMASLNLSRFGARARVVPAAVWRSDVPAGKLALRASVDAANTGGGGVVGTGGTIDAVPFDDALADILARARVSRARLLKLDCEGSEYPILLTSRLLHLVDEIRGEYHESNQPVPDWARVGDATRYDRHTLRATLEARGFRVVTRQHTSNPNIGLFFATRSDRP
jgi:FkbM family methyltransferase